MDNNKKEESEKFIKSEVSSTTPPITDPTVIKTSNLSTTSDNDTASTDSSDLSASWTLINDKEHINTFKDEIDDHIEILKHNENPEDEQEDDGNESLHVIVNADDDEDADVCVEGAKSYPFLYIKDKETMHKLYTGTKHFGIPESSGGIIASDILDKSRVDAEPSAIGGSDLLDNGFSYKKRVTTKSPGRGDAFDYGLPYKRRVSAESSGISDGDFLDNGFPYKRRVSSKLSGIGGSDTLDYGLPYKRRGSIESQLLRGQAISFNLPARAADQTEANDSSIIARHDLSSKIRLREGRRLPSEEPCNDTLQKATNAVLQWSYSVSKSVISYVLFMAFIAALTSACVLVSYYYLSWSDNVKKTPTLNKLEEKIAEIGFHNIIMREELDSLHDQVKQLTTLFESQQQKFGKHKNHRDGKVFKVWPGNGDSLKPVDITKEDLRKPYKCPDGSFVEFANMCLEQQSGKTPSIVDQFGQVVENLKDQSEAFKTFEQVAEELHGFQDNPSEKPANLYASHKQHLKNEDKNNNEYKKISGKDNSHERKKSKSGRRDSSELHDHDHDSAEWLEKRMKGREQLRNKSDDDHDDGDDDDSGEWHENYMKHREQQRKKNEYKNESHEWHDNYMKNREQQRKRSEQKNHYKNNGHSRENKRSGEKHYR